MFKKRNTKRALAVLLAGALLFAAAALFLAPSVAAASCFTDTEGHWAESFICWMKNKGITSGYPDGSYRPENNITRGEMAVFIQRVITMGDSQITIGPGSWVPNGPAPTGYVDYYTNVDRLRNSSPGGAGFQLSPNMLTAVLGQEMFLEGVEFCYNATHGATLTYVALQHFEGGSSPVVLATVEDGTDRSDSACRTYNLTAPTSLWGTDHVDMFITVNFPSTSDYMDIGTTTFIINHSSYSAVLDADPLRSLGLPVEILPGGAP